MLDAAELNQMIDLIQLIGTDSTLKKVSSSGGGEWCGPCPFCGGTDRFRVQPNKPGGGQWFCRGCGGGKWHSSIDYVMRCEKITFKEALERLAPLANTHGRAYLDKPKTDKEKWAAAANAFWQESARNLWSEDGWKAVKWLEKRGLSFQTQTEAGLGFNPADRWDDPERWGLPTGEKVFLPKGITIPCRDGGELHYVKIRRPSGDPKYFILKGSTGWLYGSDTFKNALSAFLFESEFDALLAFQSLPGVGCASLPAGNCINSIWQPIFDPIEDLIIAYDQDEEGQKAAGKIIEKIPAFHLAGPTPTGKDLSEYYLAGGDVLEWMLGELERMKGQV